MLPERSALGFSKSPRVLEALRAPGTLGLLACHAYISESIRGRFIVWMYADLAARFKPGLVMLLTFDCPRFHKDFNRQTQQCCWLC